MATEVKKEMNQRIVWSDPKYNTKIVTTDKDEFLCHVSLSTDLDFTPAEVLKIFNNPDNSKIFRDITEIGYHKVVEEDGKGFQKWVVEQKSGFNFLFWPIRFSTVLECQIDTQQQTFKFELKQSGMMKKFSGDWKLEEIKIVDKNGKEKIKTHAKFEQDILPSFMPPFSHGILKRISQSAVLRVVEDMHKLAEVVRAGGSLDDILINGYTK